MTTEPRLYETIISDAAVAKGYYMAVPAAIFQLVELKRLRPADVAMYCVLYHHMTRRKGWRVEDGIKNGMTGARIGVDRIMMRMLGLASRDAVFASLARLETAGVITRTRRSRKVNAFTIAPVSKWDRSRPAYRPKRTTPRATPTPGFGSTRRVPNGHADVVEPENVF